MTARVPFLVAVGVVYHCWALPRLVDWAVLRILSGHQK